MSDVILLRKLTEKSTLKFGQYGDVSIYNLLDLHRTKYLRWVYYNCSNITFIDEILFKIGILEDEFIPKPSVNREMLEIVNQRISSNTRDFLKEKNKKRASKIIKGKNASSSKRDKITYSKDSLRRKNHGN